MNFKKDHQSKLVKQIFKLRGKNNIITRKDILKAQEAWGNAIVKIGKLKADRESYEKITDKLLDKLYAFKNGEILFKPTRAAAIQFRTNKEGAMSYFIGGNDNFPEDKGFALQPWTNIRFENAAILFERNIAAAMGNYYFIDINNREMKVEYTFGYIKNKEGELKINLHHSSIPFNPST
ncbi:hypothetical protein BMS3Abin03_01624 [bacterium BMS3Abin03]|nr:hypothetical protein BMS3Abin03_01624 [bacterium BMS3Abin03]